MIEVGELRLDPVTRRVSRGEHDVQLSAKEFALLETFMRRPGHVLSRFELLEHAWDYAYENRSNVVDVYVRYLRDKIDRPFGRESLETVRGVGYRLRPGAEPMSRLPIRLRLTLAFAVAMAIVLIVAGGILYARLGSSLQEGIDDNLEARSLTLTALVQPAGPQLVD